MSWCNIIKLLIGSNLFAIIFSKKYFKVVTREIDKQVTVSEKQNDIHLVIMKEVTLCSERDRFLAEMFFKEWSKNNWKLLEVEP